MAHSVMGCFMIILLKIPAEFAGGEFRKIGQCMEKIRLSIFCRYIARGDIVTPNWFQCTRLAQIEIRFDAAGTIIMAYETQISK